MRQSDGSEILSPDDPRNLVIGIIHVSPNDDRQSVIKAITIQDKLGRDQIILDLPIQNKVFKTPHDFEWLRQLRSELEASLLLILSPHSNVVNDAKQQGFILYHSIEELVEAEYPSLSTNETALGIASPFAYQENAEKNILNYNTAQQIHEVIEEQSMLRLQSTNSRRTRCIFFCYAREDETLLNELKVHLIALQKQQIIDIWYDRNISAGVEWEQEIQKYLDRADIILLLVSPHFLASDYCYSTEVQRAMARHAHGEARVIPVILRPVYWQQAPFSKLQVLPADARPVTDAKWHSLDDAFFSVAEGIRIAIDELNRA